MIYNGKTHNGSARLQEAIPQAPPAPPSWTKFVVFQVSTAAFFLACLLYMAIVLIPKLSDASKVLECERCREETHAKKIEALRKAQIIEGAILLQDLREARKLMQKQ